MDSYKTMFQRMVEERNVLAERNAYLEYSNKLLQSQLEESQKSSGNARASQSSLEVLLFMLLTQG